MIKKQGLDFLQLESKEVMALALATLVLAFGFSYRFTGPFSLGNWFGNFTLTLILVISSLAVFEIAQRYHAQTHLAKINSNIFIFGLIATILVTIISDGYIVFAAPLAITITSYYAMRPGYKKPHLGPHDASKIALSGPLACLGLAIIAKLLYPMLGPIAEKLVFINISLAIFNLIPFYTILPFMFLRMKGKKPMPYVAGEYVFFGSRPLWVFMFVFVLVASLSLYFLSILMSLVFAITLGIIFWFLWHYYFEGAKPKP